MKLMIMTDLEGVAGILNFEDWCVPGAMYYDKAKRLLTLEVNAAVDGFSEGGAEEILVVDGHGHGAMDPELLDERAQLMRGRAKLSAVNLAPARSRALIREGALNAIEKLKRDPSSFRYPDMKPPYIRTARYRKRGDSPGFSTRDEHAGSIIGLMNMPQTRLA